jgi:hypothetical protein
MIKGKLTLTSGINDGVVATGLSQGQSHSGHGFFRANWVHVHKTPFIGSLDYGKPDLETRNFGGTMRHRSVPLGCVL